MNEALEKLAHLLTEQGVGHVFGVAGSGPSMTLITALEARGVRYHPVAHEAAGAMMAGGVHRASGHLSASISVKGPGLCNMLPGVAHNRFENLAVLSISEAYGLDDSLHALHKRLDHAALVRPIVKARACLSDMEQWSRLIAAASSEAPGPVHLDLCRGDAEPSKIHPRATVEHPTIRIRHAARPVLIVGSWAMRRSWRKRLASLRIPIFTTAAAKGVIDERTPFAAGVYTAAGRELAPESGLLAEADLVVGVGLRCAEVIRPRPLNNAVLVDAVDDGQAGGFAAHTACLAAGDDEAADALEMLAGKEWGADRIATAHSRLRGELHGPAWLPARCFEVLNTLAYDYALGPDTGLFCTIGEHLWRAGPDRPYFGSSNGRYMGTALPSAIGYALAAGGRPVVCAIGDGGMAHVAELKLAVEERLPLCVILMSDGGYASIAAAGVTRRISQRAVTVYRPTWWRAVEALGCRAVDVAGEVEFAAALEGWSRSEPLFIEARFEPAAYRTQTERLR